MSSVGAPQSPALPKGGKAPAAWRSAAQPQGSGSGVCRQGRQDARNLLQRERGWAEPGGRLGSPGHVYPDLRPPGIRGQRPPYCRRMRVWHPALRRDRRPLRRRSDREPSSAAAGAPPALGKPGGAPGRRVPAASLLPRSCRAPPSAGPPAGAETAALGTLRGISRAVQASLSCRGTAASGPGPPPGEDDCPPGSPGRRPRGPARTLLT